MKDLIAQFLPRFRGSAGEQLARARELLASGDSHGVDRELHRLAGDAAVLGLADLASLARRGQEAARLLGSDGGATMTDCSALLDQIADALDAL
jgi:HPt (histidine-containing phosphotransfer) domain-containing protein